MVAYNEEQSARVIEAYKESPTRETIELLSKEMEKSIKSVIGKLSREGIYRSEGYKTKAGEKPITKLEMVAILSDELGYNLEGLEKAPKQTLRVLGKALRIEFEEVDENAEN